MPLNQCSNKLNYPRLFEIAEARAWQQQQQRGFEVVINASKPEAALQQLLQHVQQPEMQQLMLEDLQQVVHQISSATQQDHVRAKLEVIMRQSCPNWHADSVGIRMLCTYQGPGTWYLSNRHVTRLHNPWTADVTIGAVDEQYAVQAAQGDWLYLKGNAFPGLAEEGTASGGTDIIYCPAELSLHPMLVSA
eukprot:gene6604-6832_t